MSPCLNNPYSGAPSPDMREAMQAIDLPEHFNGRVGALICNSSTTSTVTYAYEKTPYTHTSYQSLSNILVGLGVEEIPRKTLTNACGEKLELSEFFDLLFANYPDKPLMQGGSTLELRKRLWRAAIVKVLDSPTIKLLSYFIQSGIKCESLEINEMWIGPSTAHEIRHHRAFISPYSVSRHLFNWMSQGLNPSSPHGLWPVDVSPSLPILFENNDVIVIDKPAKLASVPGIKETVNAKDALQKQLGMELFIVHRLDTDTSGVLLFAKSKKSQSSFSEAFRSHLAFKRYRALLEGKVTVPHGSINLPIATSFLDAPRQCVLPETLGAKPSKTDFEVIGYREKQGRTQTLVDLYPETGRTHQLRVHCAHKEGLNAPIVNDPFYGINGLIDDVFENKLHLHAAELTVTDPRSGVVIHATSPAPF